MNIYVGNSFEELNENSIGDYFTAELGEFLYQNRANIPVDLTWLFNIDPYDDVVIDRTIVPKIWVACSELKKLEIWKLYEHPEDGECAIRDLLKLAEKASLEGKGLVSEGD